MPKVSEQEEFDAVEAFDYLHAALHGEDAKAADILNRHLRYLDSSHFLGILTGIGVRFLHDAEESIGECVNSVMMYKAWRASTLIMNMLRDEWDDED